MPTHRVGGTVVVMEHFDPEQYLALVQEHRITFSQVVPTMFIRLLKLPAEVRSRYDLSSLQAVVHAAAPCPAEVKAQIIEWFGPIIHEYYAGTEGNGFVYCNSQDWLAHKGTVGKAILGVIHIVGEDGEEVPTGESGTVYFEGEAASTFEYHNDAEKTASSRDPKGRGWSTLGDVGYLDDDGFLYLTDRKAYMIITGGVNVYPQEAENVLAIHPEGERRGRLRRAERGLRRGGEGGGRADVDGRSRAGARAGAHRLLQGAPGRRQVPPFGGLPHRAPPPPHRQALQAAAQGRVLGRRRTHDLAPLVPANAAYPFLDSPVPLAFAHRGGASEAPENTMPAFEHAVRLGYRYLETDAHVTVDGVLVAFHDERLDRVTDRAGVIAELPWRAVNEARVDGREPIPLLEDLLTAWPDVRINIDPKQDAAAEPLAAAILRTRARRIASASAPSATSASPR